LLVPDKNPDPRRRAWRAARVAAERSSQRVCNICGWHGTAFVGGPHSEGALCPHCGSIARDRFLYWCWTERVPYNADARLLETSPRLDERYRNRMARLVHYTASDYDLSAHRAMIQLDLQKIELPDASLDVVLTPHVLEHVPDTHQSLRELHRVLAPGGDLLLMIPMPQGRTAPPVEPEYHGDNTLVYWRFGWDLRDMIEAAGFEVSCLVTQDLIDRIVRGQFDSGWTTPDHDEISLLEAADPTSLTAVADHAESQRYGFEPDLLFIVWHCRRSAT
jgi:SAM-dependent methyltransferase